MSRVPEVNLSECRDCDSCVTVSPGVFRRNADTGCIEVVALSDYPIEEIQEAITMCPTRCIHWQET